MPKIATTTQPRPTSRLCRRIHKVSVLIRRQCQSQPYVRSPGCTASQSEAKVCSGRRTWEILPGTVADLRDFRSPYSARSSRVMRQTSQEGRENPGSAARDAVPRGAYHCEDRARRAGTPGRVMCLARHVFAAVSGERLAARQFRNERGRHIEPHLHRRKTVSDP